MSREPGGRLRRTYESLSRYGLLAGAWTVAATLGSKVQTLAGLAIVGFTGGLTASGQYGLIVGTAVLCATIADFGFSSYLTRAVASGEMTSTRAVLRPSLTRVASTLPLALVAVALLGLQGPLHMGWLTATALIAYACAFQASAIAVRLAYGAGLFRAGSSIHGSVRALSILPMAMIPALGAPPLSVILVMAAGEVVIAIAQLKIAAPHLSAGEDAKRPSLGYRASWRLGVAGIANVLANRSDVVVVALFATAVALGEYNIGSQVENALTVAALVPAGATVTYVARSSNAALQHRLRLVTTAAVGAAYVVLATPFVVAPQVLVPALFGVDLGDYAVVQICAVAGLFSALAGVQLQVLVGRNEQGAVLLVWCLLVPIAAASLGIGMHFGSASGAAWGALARDIAFLLLTVAVSAGRRVKPDAPR